MAYQIGTAFRTEKGKHRLHDLFATLVFVLASVQTAVVFRRGGNTQWPAGTYMSFESAQFQGEIRLPLGGVVETTGQSIPVNSIGIGLEAKSWNYEQPGPGECMGRNLTEAYAKIIAPVFVEFYEDYREWLESQALLAQQKAQHLWMLWPSVWQFARIVRNAMSHGGGRINIDDPKFTPVTWYNLTYGHAENGRQIVGTDMPISDIIILMLEMNDALDQLGCPI